MNGTPESDNARPTPEPASVVDFLEHGVANFERDDLARGIADWDQAIALVAVTPTRP